MSRTLASPEIGSLLDQVPVLAGHARTVEELPGGLTNHNLKVRTAAGTFVVRLFGGESELLDIDRDAEHRNSRAAARAGAGAPVVAYRPDLGLLVIGYIEGTTLTDGSFREPGMIARAADACRRLHAGPRFVSDFDMFSRQRRYLQTVRERGFALFDGYERFLDAFEAVRRALAVRAPATVPCNNDLLAANFIDDGDRLWLIDYEYSGNNDACFELGNISTECSLDDAQQEELVTCYYGARLRNKIARARLQALVSEYGWSLWGVIQAATSPLEFDFDAWGRYRFEKAAATFTSRTFPTLLDEVQRDD
jgi:thiamine kinase-like enzyme